MAMGAVYSLWESNHCARQSRRGKVGIVLDRGSAISFDGFSQIDLLFESEDYSYNFGRKENVIFEILRLGY